MFRGNPQLTGVAAESLSNDLQLCWRFEATGAIESSAALTSDTIYFGCHDGFCYALPGEKRSPQECRNARQALQAPVEIGPRRVGRPPKTRMALLSALRGYTRPRSVETLADRVGLSVGAVRSVLANMVSEGLVVATKLRTDREDMRLVYHYELARDEHGRESRKPKPSRRKRK